MKTLTTFIWPIRIWQISALIPLSVSTKTAWPKPNTFLKYFALTSLFAHFVCFCVAMYYNEEYIDWTQKQFAVIHDIFAVAAVQMLVCVVVGESIKKIDLQIDFLKRLSRIDYAIQYKTQIKINYKKYQSQNSLGTFVWLAWHLFCLTTVFMYYYSVDNVRELLMWSIYAIPLFVYSLQYQRIILYVHQIGERFRVLNQYLLDNFSTCGVEGSAWDLITAIKGYSRSEIIQPITDMNEARVKLLEVRHVYQQLAEACDAINTIFGQSLPMCIAVDFHKVLSNIYWLFLVWLDHQGFGESIAPTLWLSLNLVHLIPLTYTCQATSKEVSCKRVLLGVFRELVRVSGNIQKLFDIFQCYFLNQFSD